MKTKNFSTMRMLGSQLQAARKAAGFTQRSLAEAVMVDEQTIASIEQGRRSLLIDLAHTLDELLGTKGTLAAGVANLPDIDQFPLYAEQYMVHEREAVTLSWYDNSLVPGLLQTEQHAHAVLCERVPTYDPDELATKLAARMKRQEILDRKCPPTMSFIVWEPVPHLRIGGEKTRRDQIRHLRACAERPGLTLQLLPMQTSSHAALDGPFILLETPDFQHLAYAEGVRGSQWVSDPNEVSVLARKYAMLRSQALSPKDSKDLLDRLLGAK